MEVGDGDKSYYAPRRFLRTKVMPSGVQYVVWNYTYDGIHKEYLHLIRLKSGLGLLWTTSQCRGLGLRK